MKTLQTLKANLTDACVRQLRDKRERTMANPKGPIPPIPGREKRTPSRRVFIGLTVVRRSQTNGLGRRR